MNTQTNNTELKFAILKLLDKNAILLNFFPSFFREGDKGEGDKGDELLDIWNQPHRFYHNLTHLYNLLIKIEDVTKNTICTDTDKEVLQIVALYHDIVYNPKETVEGTNEIASAQKFELDTSSHTNNIYKEKIKKIIFNTIYTDYYAPKHDDYLAKIFCRFDLGYLDEAEFDYQLIENEKLIFKEYQFVPFDKYKEAKVQFLTKLQHSNRITDGFNNIEYLKEYVSNMKPNVALYAGSFNPLHVGHMNIIEQAEKIFDKVIVAIGKNPEKIGKNNKFTYTYELSRVLPFHETVIFDGLLTDLVVKYEEMGCHVTLIRGLRNGYDLQYEANQLRFLQDLKPDIKTVYIYGDKEFEHISSSAIRGLVSFDYLKALPYFPSKYNYASRT